MCSKNIKRLKEKLGLFNIDLFDSNVELIDKVYYDKESPISESCKEDGIVFSFSDGSEIEIKDADWIMYLVFVDELSKDTDEQMLTVKELV